MRHQEGQPRDPRGAQGARGIPADSVIAYAEILAITVVALLVLGIGGVWLYSQAASPDGLSGAEIGSLVAIIVSGLNQLAIWRASAQIQAQGRETKTKIDEAHETENGGN